MSGEPESVKAMVYYLGNPIGERPYWGSPASGKGCNIIDVGVEATITDIRSLPEEAHKEFTLDTAGFTLVKHESNEKEFANKEELKPYYKECEELLKKVTGATRVLVSDSTIRRNKYGDGNYQAGPAIRVHCDQSPRAGVNRVKESMGDDAERLLKTRCQIINLWRPIRGPVQDAPLAWVDGRTLNVETDCVHSDVIYPDYHGETFAVRHNPNHKWLYMSDMQPDDVLMFKCFDTLDKPDVPRMVPHTAFLNPNCPKDALNRWSIEVRALVFHENEENVLPL